LLVRGKADNESMLGSVTTERKRPEFSDEWRANMSRAHTGLLHSTEHRQAIAAAATPENIAKASRAALASIALQLEKLGAVTLPVACEHSGVNYAVAYTWATAGRGDQLRWPFFRGPRGDICCKQEEFDGALEQSRCKWEAADEQRCGQYALLSSDGLCREHSAAKRMRERFQSAAAAVRREGLWLAPDVMAKIAVSGPYLSRTLVRSGRLRAEERVIAGRRCWVFRPNDVRAFQRARPVSRWHNPEWVQRRVLNSGMVDRRAEAEGISKSQALEQYLAEVDVRRRRPAGRPPRADAPEHHYDWLRRFCEIRENHESHAYAGEPMPKPSKICLEVALEDYLEHPDRWPDYEPAKLPKSARDRVWTAVKPLLIAESEIPPH
jgi:hypothetical protein